MKQDTGPKDRPKGSPPPTSTPPAWLRAGKTLLLAAVFIPVLVLTAGSAFLNSNYARNLLLAEINRGIAGRLLIGAHQVSLPGGRLVIQDAKLNTPANRSVAGFQKLSVQWRWAALLRGNLEFVSILVDRPWTDTVFGPGGRMDFWTAVETIPKTSEIFLKDKEGTGTAWPVFGLAIDELSIQDGRIAVGNAGTAQQFRLAGIQAHGRVDLPAESADLKLETSSGAFRFRGIDTAMGPVTFAARGRGRRVDILALDLQAPAGTLSGSGTVQMDGPVPRVDIETRWQVSLDQLAEAFGNENRLAGTADVTGSIHGPLRNPRATLSAVMTTPAVGLIRLPVAVLHASLNDRVLEFQGEGDDGVEGRFLFSGTLDVRKAFPDGFLSPGDFRQAVYRFDARQQNFHLAGILPFDHFAKGVINGRQQASGTGLAGPFRRMNLTAEASAAGLLISPNAGPIDVRLECSAALDEGTLRMDRWQVLSGDTSLQLDGRFHLQERHADLRFELRSPDIAERLLPFGIDGVAGAVNASGKMTGPLFAPVFSVRGSADRLRLKDIMIGDVQFAADMDSDGVFQVSELWIRDPAGDVRIQGTAHFPEGRWQLDPRIRIDATADLHDFDLDRFHDVLPLGGRCNGQIRLAGPLASAAGSASLTGENLSWAGYRMGRLQSRLRWSSGRLLVDRMTLVNGDADVTLSGEMQALKPGSLQPLARPEVRLAVTGDIPDLHVFQSDLGGHMALQAEFQGTFPDLRGNISVSAGNIRHPWANVSQVDIDTVFEQETFRIRRCDVLFAPGEALHVSGSFGLQGTFDGEITSTEISLARIPRLQALSPVGGRLKVGFSGKIAGRLNAPLDEVSASADIAAVTVSDGGRRVVRDGLFRASLHRGTLQIDQAELLFDGGGRLQVRGVGGMTGPLDFAASGRFPGAVLQWIDPAMPPVAGNLDLAGYLKGTWDTPEADITVDLQNISLPIPGLTARLQALSGRIHVTEKQVSIGPLQARVGEGTCRFQGTMPLDRFRPAGFDFALRAESLPIQKPGILTMTLDGDLTLRGTPARSRIEGSLEVLAGAYTRDVRLDLVDGVTVRRRPAPKDAAAEANPLLEGMALQVAVSFRQPFQVVNNLARLQLAPDLQVAGTAAAPVLLGRADVLSGSIEYRKRGFRITRGIIDFIDPYRTRPVLDVTGETRVRDWDIFLQLTGPLEALVFQFRSEPMAAEEDIVSLLLLGKTTRELIQAEGGVAVSPGGLLADLIVSKYGKQLQGATGIDTLAVDSGENGSGSNVKVTVGKNLSERLSLKYTTGTGSQGFVQEATAEYKLLETLLVTGFQNNRGVFGGNLVFRLEFQ